ncbi:MAG: DegT/DnrJ/EryC1/StrS family aminotransferase [Deltaproteobacteria bacterium]|nr:DegT/DnrJ/EryC1/StrS family aminotransferase [Candidatus Zymogenaceae bacterium]
MQDVIPHSRPTIDTSDIDAVAGAVGSEMLVDGPYAKEFSAVLAKRLGTPDAVPVSSGTAALHLALCAAGISPDDEVILPAYVCVSPLLAVRYTGARPILCDVDPASCLMTADHIRSVITKRTKAVIAVHLFGRTAPMDDIMALAKEHNLFVVEDCAQAVGAEYRGNPAGSFGDAAVFSFYATKVITSGQGGMLTSPKPEITETARDLIRYDQRDDVVLRYNYRMSDIQAALGLSQLSRLDRFLDRRQEIAEIYREACETSGIEPPPERPEREDIHYRFVIRTGGVTPSVVINRFNDLGIHAERPVYAPLFHYTKSTPLPGAFYAFERYISIPIYPSLSDDSIARITGALNQCIVEES